MTAGRMLDIAFFLCVVLIGLWTCLIRTDQKKRKELSLLKAGMLLTILADCCLLIFRQMEIGVTIFCFVQAIYAVRYDIKRARRTLAWLGAAAGCVIAVFLCADFLPEKPLYAVACIYGICLGTAVCRAGLVYFRNGYPSPARELIFAGMVLFLLCDINVALYNMLPAHMTFVWMGRPVRWTRFCGMLIWVFYLPSLLCLSLSGRRFKNRFDSPARRV